MSTLGHQHNALRRSAIRRTTVRHPAVRHTAVRHTAPRTVTARRSLTEGAVLLLAALTCIALLLGSVLG